MKRLAAFCIAALMAAPAAADEMTFNIETTDQGYQFLVAKGTISDLSPWLLGAVLASGRFRNGVITLESRGGDVAGAMGLGRLLREYQITTVVPADAECFSACAFAFLGGEERVVGEGAKLGMHRFRWASEGVSADKATRGAQEYSGALIEYFQEMGVSPDALVLGMRTPAEEMYVFGPSEMKRFHLTHERTID